MDLCDKEGAERLAAHIRAYWQARGGVVRVWLEEAAFTPAMRSNRYDVRSDLVNGAPRAYTTTH